MKRFCLIPTSLTYGVLYDGDRLTSALFLTPKEAKFEATFRALQAAGVRVCSTPDRVTHTGR